MPDAPDDLCWRWALACALCEAPASLDVATRLALATRLAARLPWTADDVARWLPVVQAWADTHGAPLRAAVDQGMSAFLLRCGGAS